MALVKLANATGATLMYKINVDNTLSGELQRLQVNEVRTVSGDREPGTMITIWWRRGDGVAVRDCHKPGCNPGVFVMPGHDVGIRLGEDLIRFPEQTINE